MDLTKTELGKILSYWDFVEVVSCSKLSQGESNHNWFVKTNSKDYILRRAPDFRKSKELNFEITYLLKLKDSNFPYAVPVPIKSSEGYIVKFQGGNWWLYESLKGKVIDSISIELIPELGKMLSKYHLFLERANISNGLGKSDPFNKKIISKELRNYVVGAPNLASKSEANRILLKESAVLLDILKSVDSKNYSKLPQYPIHRDLNPENILWENGKLTGIIDFENVGTMNDSFVADISFAIMFACTTEEDFRVNIHKAKILFEAYKKYRSLSDLEVGLVFDALMTGFIEAFNWQYWLQLNSPERTKIHRLELYSMAAQWIFRNKNLVLNKVLRN